MKKIPLSFKKGNRRNISTITLILLFVLVYKSATNQTNNKTVQVSIIKNGIETSNNDFLVESEKSIEVVSIAENPLTALNSRFFKYVASHLIENKTYAGAQNYIDYTIINLGLKPLENVKPLRPGHGMVVNDVTAFKYPINIPKCRKDSIANRTLFLGIWSAPNYVYSNRRKLVRQTWLKHIQDPHYHRGLLDVISYGFIIGQTSNQAAQKAIEEESKKYGDILQVEMDDTYRNLTRKTVSILNWVNSNCAHADFAIKIDDDVYVNVHNLATVLAKLSPEEVSLYGQFAASNVFRTGKHFSNYLVNIFKDLPYKI